MNEELITIVTATLGSNKSIEKTIKSVIDQTYLNWEQVVIYKTDPRKLDLNIQEDFRIKYIEQSQSGIYQNFNKGIEESRGKFIVILNDDDWLEPDFLELSITALSNSNYIGTYCDSKIWDDSKNFSYKPAKENLAKNLLLDFIGAYHNTFLIRKAAFVEYGGFRIKDFKGNALHYANDYEWFVRLILKDLRFKKIQNVHGNFSLGGASTKQRLKLIMEGSNIASYYANNFFSKSYIICIWKLRYFYNWIKLGDH